MTSISPETNDRKKGTVAEVFDESLSAELINLIWGQERTAMPTVVDYAYEEIWKRVIMIGGSEEQRLSDVTLAEQLGGMSRTPVRQALDRLVQEGLLRSDPRRGFWTRTFTRSEEHTSELQSHSDLVCRLLLEKKNRHKELTAQQE